MAPRGPVVAATVALLVVLSGCAVLGGGSTQTPTDATTTADPTPSGAETTTPPDGETGGDTATPTDSPTPTPTPTATPSPTAQPTPTPTPDPTPEHELTSVPQTPGGDLSLPPGVRSDGRVNETRLLSAHLQAANRSGWSLRHTNGNRTTVLFVSGETTYSRDDRGVTWSRGNTTVTNDTLIGAPYETTFARNTTLGDLDPTSTVLFALAIRLGTGEYEWAGTERGEGDRLHRLVMTDTKSAGGAVGYYTGEMLVDERGRIHRLSGTVGDNRSAATAYEFDYSFPVESVPKPEWFDAVPRTEAAKVDGGRAFRVTVTGGPALPAGSEFTLEHNDTERTVTLDQPLAAGESLCLGLRGENRTLVQSRDALSGEGLVDLRGTQTRLEGTVTIDGREIDVRITIGRISL